MKHSFNSAMRYNRSTSPVHQTFYSILNNAALSICLVMLITFLAGCQKEDIQVEELQGANKLSTDNVSGRDEGNILNAYTGLSGQTMWELQQARAATARYRNIENAIRDGYVDIAVDVEGMGHHYMKATLVDATFNMREPEILVYNRNHDGIQELVAVEYAVPLTSPMPEGFSGSGDVWNGTSGFPLWLLHAWVWTYNPLGVFNPTNPNVHLH